MPNVGASSKVLMLGAEKFSGESGRSINAFAKYPDGSLAEVNLSGHWIDWIDWIDIAGARDVKSLLAGVRC